MKNWKTTLTGVTMVLGAVTGYLSGTMTLELAIAAAITGLGFIFAKDNDKTGV